MKQVTKFEEISPLLSAQLKKGVITNNFLSREDYDQEIANGLYIKSFDGGLFLFRRRTDYFILNFYLQTGIENLPPLPQGTAIVTELVRKPRGADVINAAAPPLSRLGFRKYFCRRRCLRTEGAAVAAAEAPFFPAPEVGEELLTLMEENFDHYAGCIPPLKVLRRLIEQKQILCTADEKGLSGLLHFSEARNVSEIRHLAVRKDRRKQGLAASLTSAYLRETKQKKSLVWVRQDNIPAQDFYAKFDYKPDGWESAVLLLKND